MVIDQAFSDYFLEVERMLGAMENDAPLAAALAPFSFTAEWLTESRALFEEVKSLHDARQREYGEQVAATAALDSATQAAYDHYRDALQVARVIFRKDAAAQQALGLNGRRQVSQSGRIQQMRAFYRNALEDARLLAALTQYTYDETKLNEGLTLVATMESAKISQDSEKGEAQAATKARDAKLEDLEERMADLRGLAVVALRPHPQWLEKMGIVEPS